MKYNKGMLSGKLGTNDIVPFFHEYEENGVFSQWHKHKFKDDDITFLCMEQYMMYWKAIMFNDKEIAKQILKTTNPKAIKDLGRKVKNFDQHTWDAEKCEIVVAGNLLKFSQIKYAHDMLLDTGDKVLVEASPYDKIWGIGIGKNDSNIFYPSKWRGENLLGFALMEVRDIIRGKE